MNRMAPHWFEDPRPGDYRYYHVWDICPVRQELVSHGFTVRDGMGSYTLCDPCQSLTRADEAMSSNGDG
jgi:hypothetical protein